MADPPSSRTEWLPPQAPGTRAAPPPEPASPAAPPGRPPTSRAPSSPANGLAVTSIVLSVCALGLLVLSLGLSFALSLPLAGGAWVCASRARRQGMTGQGQAARILALLALALGAAAMVVWLVLIASGFSPDDLQRDLERELERQRRSDDPVTGIRELRAGFAVMLGR